MDKKDYTNYIHWKYIPKHVKGEKVFPLLYWQTTGIELNTHYSFPSFPGLLGNQINAACKQGFFPDIEIDSKLKPSGIAIPLLDRYRHVGAFLTLYGRHGGLRDLRWVKYTLQGKVGSETPLIAIYGNAGRKGRGLITDSLKGYLKLINWYYCQEIVKLEPCLIIYIDQGGAEAMETVRRCQLHFSELVDLTQVSLYEKVKWMQNSEWNNLMLDKLIYFDSNPLIVSDSRKALEDYIMHLGQKL